MNIEPSIVTSLQPSKCVEPGNSTLYDPPVPSQLFARLYAAPCDTRDDASFATSVSKMSKIVSLVRMNFVRPSSGSPFASADRRNRVKHRFKHLRVVDVRRRDLTGKRHAACVYNQMVLGSELTSVGRVGPCCFAPPFARTLLESTAARFSLNRLRRLISTRSTSWIFCHTPDASHSCNRRQQLIPEPQPISIGRSSQGRPVFNTNRIPVKASRSGIRGRPPFGYSRNGGKRGSMMFHSFSGNSFRAMGKTYQEPCESTRAHGWFC